MKDPNFVIQGFCLECRWVRQNPFLKNFTSVRGTENFLCCNPTVNMNLVTGTKQEFMFCEEARKNLCGAQGRFWEGKEE